MKKAQIHINLIFSIVITIVGITLVLVLIGKNTGAGKKIYCNTVYNKDGSDKFCDEYLNLKVTSLKNKKNILNSFDDKRKVNFFHLNVSNNFRGQTFITLPTNAKIKNAKIDINLAEKKLIKFNNNEKKEIIIFPPGRLELHKKFQKIPEFSRIIRAKIEASGAEYPAQAQVVFVVDTSSSMVDEWEALCNILDNAVNSVKKLGMELTPDVYAMGNGETVGDCVAGVVPEEGMKTITQMVPYNFQGGNILPVYDDPREAWAPASAWLADNYPKWSYSTDNKRIIMPISDSDPTGGGQGTFDGTNWHLTGGFTGNEAKSIQDAVKKAVNPLSKYVYILPVNGLDFGDVEGYGVGLEPCNAKCKKVGDWMNDLARGTQALNTGARIVSFDDSEVIKDQIISMMTTPFPSDINISIGSSPNDVTIFEWDGELNLSNSPQVIDPVEFMEFLNEKCIGKVCDINIVSDEGTVILNKLDIRYLLDPELNKMEIADIVVSDFSSLSYDEPHKEIDIKSELEKALENCPKDEKYCEIPIMIFGDKKGYIEFSNLEIEYEYYDLEQDLLEKIVECHFASNKGNLGKNLICEEMLIGNIFEYDYPITESSITKMIKEMNFCHIIKNSDHGCGDEDLLHFEQELYEIENILIEYNDEKKQIIVS
ncbi:hypothetical protein HOD20_00375 [archaeon]|nr:hypothetical protein [archaeon]MBT4646894.1 hypothetical protein [archaeon]MBT6822139.1 hypothetical protein [archaeon]MBT7392982.1 hypothetical protein [archaeon]